MPLPIEIVPALAGVIAVTPAMPTTTAVKRDFMETSSRLEETLLRLSEPSFTPFSTKGGSARAGVQELVALQGMPELVVAETQGRRSCPLVEAVGCEGILQQRPLIS